MLQTDFFDPNMAYSHKIRPTDVTLAIDLSNETQNELYCSEIKRTIHRISQAGPSHEKGTAYIKLTAITLREVEPETKNWPAELYSIGEIYKNYFYYLTNSWSRDIELSHFISRIRHSPNINNADRIANRLEYLGKTWGEEVSDGDLISSNSLQSFINFLSINPKIRYPDITLTPTGNIYARWKGLNKSLFSLHFLQDLKVRFVIFALNRKHPKEINRISGNECVDTVIDNLNSAYSITDWILE